MFVLKFDEIFIKTYKKYVKKDIILQKKIIKALEIIRNNPFHNSLKTHKVTTRRNKDVWSSWVSGDWRVIWIFDENTKTATIVCLEIGTHSGSNKVYR